MLSVTNSDAYYSAGTDFMHQLIAGFPVNKRTYKYAKVPLPPPIKCIGKNHTGVVHQ